MRGLNTPVSELRKQVFVEVAKVAYESENVNNDIEAIPYKVTPGDAPRFRDSIYRERAIAAERVRLAMGTVSYTHLDVYKRQVLWNAGCGFGNFSGD